MLLPTLAALILPAALSLASPPIFTAKTYDQAKQQSIDEKRLLVVDSMADWCPPCKKMDKTTWVDPKVVEWFAANAIAFQFDTDKQPELAQQFAIELLPTTIILKDGKEIDRDTGYKSAAELIAWLEDVKQGKTKAAEREQELKRLREKAGTRVGKNGKVDIDERLDLARKLSESDPDLAAAEYAWLWDNMLQHKRSMAGVRLSFMVSEMHVLAFEHPPAKEVFTKLRDAAEARLKDQSATKDTLTDWIRLNTILNDEDRTIAWYDRVKDDPAATNDLRRNSAYIKEALKTHARWVDVGRISARPMDDVRETMTSLDTRLPGDERQQRAVREALRSAVRTNVSGIYAGLLISGREKQANEVATHLILTLDDATSRVALVEEALKANHPREEHLTLLDTAATKSSHPKIPELRAKVEQALTKGK
ncbi:MAG TPA: thioredoxin family protein [Phycisphaerales bacterium]|nr:thioredoxin family protein [Phycisphaerales bacterium]